MFKKILVTATFLIFAFATVLSAAADNVKAPDFELKDTNGTLHRISDYKGKVVLVNFWASWCTECIEEMPSLNILYERFRKSDFVVLGISIDRNQSKLSDAMEKTNIAYPVLMDTKGEVFVKKFTVIGLPTSVLIDQQGLIRETIIGRHDFASNKFIEKINNMIKVKK